MSINGSILYDNASLNSAALPSVGDIEVIGAANGTFIAVWVDSNGFGADLSGSALVVRVFDPTGVALIPEGNANTVVTAGNQDQPDLVALDDGGAALVYTSGGGDIYFERRDATGTIINAGALSATSSIESQAAVTGYGSNGLFVAYQDFENGNFGIKARVVDQFGNVSSEIIVDNQADNQTAPAVDTLANGNAVIAYIDQVDPSGNSIVRAAFINPASNFGAGNILVTTTGARINSVDVAALSDGGFVVVWEEGATGSRDVFYQLYDALGNLEKGRTAVDANEVETFGATVEAGADGFALSYFNTDTGPQIGGTGGLVQFQRLWWYDNAGNIVSQEGLAVDIGQSNSLDAAVASDNRSVQILASGSPGDVDITGRVLDGYRTSVSGTGGADALFANRNGGVSVLGLGGNDRLYALEGNDTLLGGSGDDILFGNRGTDLMDGGSGVDTVDYTYLGGAVTLLSRGVIDKQGLGVDTLQSSFGPGGVQASIERIVGASGFQNRIDGENSADSTFNVDLAAGTLQILFDSSSPIAGDQLVFQIANFTHFNGTANADIVAGDGQANDLRGADGNDILFGKGGNDFIVGGGGDDYLAGGMGSDTIFGSEGNDTFAADLDGVGDQLGAGAGTDTITYAPATTAIELNLQSLTAIGVQIGADAISGFERAITGSGNDLLIGGAGTLFLSGGGGADTLLGGSANNELDGGSGNDFVRGYAGADRIIGGSGNDTLQGDFNADTFVFANGFGSDTIVDFEAFNNVEKIDLAGVSDITSYADLVANHLLQSGQDALILDGVNSIRLLGVSVADLDANDFVF